MVEQDRPLARAVTSREAAGVFAVQSGGFPAAHSRLDPSLARRSYDVGCVEVLGVL